MIPNNDGTQKFQFQKKKSIFVIIRDYNFFMANLN